jgi:hypothetical protein
MYTMVMVVSVVVVVVVVVVVEESVAVTRFRYLNNLLILCGI